MLVPVQSHGAFLVNNDGIFFGGDLGVFIDREVYLNGGYEAESIALFLAEAASDRRGVIFDVGCNAGTHSLQFAKAFAAVHAFDPNPALWGQFESNVALNGANNVTLHRIGLGNAEAKLPLYSIGSANHGLGTFSTNEQYDEPLVKIGEARVENGSEYARSLGIAGVDAIKIDVQGFESEVLTGLKPILERDRPLVWVEAGGHAENAFHTLDQLLSYFPYPVTVAQIRSVSGALMHRYKLVPAAPELGFGDYIITPATAD